MSATERDRTNEALRALVASLLAAQEEERRRISRDLHDDYQQRLALLEMHVAQLLQGLLGTSSKVESELHRIEAELVALSTDMRHLSQRLYPAIVEDLGIQIALVRLGEDFQLNSSQPVTVQAHGVPEPIPPAIAIALYRIVQEALENIRKYAPDASVTIRIGCEGDTLCLRVQDDGPGFTPSEAHDGGRIGIATMQERASLAGGNLRIVSNPGRGTLVQVEVPLPEDSAADSPGCSRDRIA